MSTKRSSVLMVMSIALLIWPLTTSAQGRWYLLAPPTLINAATGAAPFPE